MTVRRILYIIGPSGPLMGVTYMIAADVFDVLPYPTVPLILGVLLFGIVVFDIILEQPKIPTKPSQER